jgi:uncharacterized protein YigE (DUF2233 family)
MENNSLMKKNFSLPIIVLLVLSLSETKVFAQEKTIASSDGLILKEFTIRDSKISTKIYAVIIEPVNIKVKIAGFSKENKSGVSPLALIDNAEAKIVLGSGFVKSFYPITPNGFLKLRNKVIVDLKKEGYNGVVGTKGNKLQLLRSNSQLIGSLYDGFQTGPILIDDSAIKFKPTSQASRNKYNRAFIAINYDGKIVAAITNEPVTLEALSEFLLNPSFKDLKSKVVFNLSGGGSETLVVKMNKTIYKYGSYSLYESALITFY